MKNSDGGNLFDDLSPHPAPGPLSDERFDALLSGGEFRLERIVSTGQASPPGHWYDQAWDEWVVVLKGRAGLLIEGREHIHILGPGDWIRLPAHLRHRVEWTDPQEATVWLALHYTAPD